MTPLTTALPIVAATCAFAQPADPLGIGADGRPVTQGLNDVGPLGVEAQVPRVDLRLPFDFGRVYRLDTPGATADETVFARGHGGITAVFPRSVYSSDGASIPPGTTWVIGEMPDWLRAQLGVSAPSTAAGSGSLLDRAVRTRVDTRAISNRLVPRGAAGERIDRRAWSGANPTPIVGSPDPGGEREHAVDRRVEYTHASTVSRLLRRALAAELAARAAEDASPEASDPGR
jgi:hypothetical protein